MIKENDISIVILLFNTPKKLIKNFKNYKDFKILVLDQSFETGKSLKSLLYDEIFDLDLTPNRSDCLSVIGIVREISAILNAQNINHKLLKQINFETTNSNTKYPGNFKDICKSY